MLAKLRYSQSITQNDYLIRARITNVSTVEAEAPHLRVPVPCSPPAPALLPQASRRTAAASQP